ncbi:MAG: Ldh family oxidoreductase [Synergistales bacterium]|nr:Ldh family oxidoreductase [Synergistales bacterium]
MTPTFIPYDRLLAFTGKLLEAMGYPRDRAAETARVLVEADARGVPSHGVARLKFYKHNIDGGFAVPDAEPEVVHETPLSRVIDGHNGIGSHISRFAMDSCITKAKEIGAGFASVRNSNHFGMAGLWAEEAAREGQIGMAFTNTRRCAIVTHGREMLLGTNPIAVAIPTGKSLPFLLDMATTTVAHGKIEVYDRRDREMPLGWAVDEHGRGTRDAHHIERLFQKGTTCGGHLLLGGEGEELGGHKGYGLGLLVELLCSGLSLGRWSARTFQAPGSGITHFFAAIRLDLFGEQEAIEEHIAAILADIRSSERAAEGDRIYIHGEKEAEAREDSLRLGIPLDDATVRLLRGYAEQWGVASPL